MPVVLKNNEEDIPEDDNREKRIDTKNKIEILSARIEYDTNLLLADPIASRIDFFERNYQLDRSTVNWYSNNFQVDLSDEIPQSFFTLPHWYIKCGDMNLFKFYQKNYTSIDLVLGQEKTFWRFSRSQTPPQVQVLRGETTLGISSCPCCIGHQFKRIIETIKNYCKNYPSEGL